MVAEPRVVQLIGPGTVVPVHYDDYGVFHSPLSAFVAELRARGEGDRLQTVVHGETVPLPARTRSS